MPIRPFKILLLLLLTQSTIAQNRILKGIVKDAHSDERIPFASMQFKDQKTGRLSDSSGSFIFHFNQWPTDTLIISYVGYQDFKLPIDSFLLQRAKNNVVDISILMERARYE